MQFRIDGIQHEDTFANNQQIQLEFIPSQIFSLRFNYLQRYDEDAPDVSGASLSARWYLSDKISLNLDYSWNHKLNEHRHSLFAVANIRL